MRLLFLSAPSHVIVVASGVALLTVVNATAAVAQPVVSGVGATAVPVRIIAVPEGHPDLVAISSLVIALASALFSFVVYRYTSRFNRSQVMIDFHRRFDELTQAKYEALGALKPGDPTDPAANTKVAAFIMRYWDMHYAEFVFWKQGLLQPSIYSDWLETLHLNAAKPMICNTTYAEAWQFVHANHRLSPSFNDFMDCVFANGSAAALTRFKSQAREYA
jgi:sensor histidine kinase YesM